MRTSEWRRTKSCWQPDGQALVQIFFLLYNSLKPNLFLPLELQLSADERTWGSIVPPYHPFG